MKKTIVVSLYVFAAVVCAVMANAIETKPLDATYAVTGKYVVDPDPADRSRVAIYIKGDSAREIYDAILTPERVWECNGEKKPELGTWKIAGGLRCYHDDEGYSCGVRITLNDGTTEAASVCD